MKTKHHLYVYIYGVKLIEKAGRVEEIIHGALLRKRVDVNKISIQLKKLMMERVVWYYWIK